jgi:hypothetical protein
LPPSAKIREVNDTQNRETQEKEHRRVRVAGPKEIALEKVRLNVPAHDSRKKVATRLDRDESEEKHTHGDETLWLDIHSI